MKYLVVCLVLVLAACGESVSTTIPFGSQDTASATTPVVPSTTTTQTVSDTSTTSSTMATTTTTAFHIPLSDTWDTWTAILASIETGEPGAWEEAEDFAATIEDAAVLWSDDYPSLNPGYWVVHYGEFESGESAKAWCSDLPDDMTCYPRYLGPDISPLAGDDHAMLIDGQALVILDVITGERLKTFDPSFDGDGMSVGRMSLTRDASALYYSVGWEDSWYACEYSQGQIWKFDLEFGIATQIASGHNPSVSPDGRWLATLYSEQCLPDPENPESWVLTPTDTVILYDLSSGWPTESRRWSVSSPPTTYEDQQMLTWVDWRANSQSLVVVNNSGRVFEMTLDHVGAIDVGRPLTEGVLGYPQALIGDTLYATVDETPFAVGAFDLYAFDLDTGGPGESIAQSVGWISATADTTRTRLIWGHDTQVTTSSSTFGLENYLISFAW
ncbi:MAG: hypothetical protein ACN4GK_03395 [Acidimicrobiia bacterium]